MPKINYNGSKCRFVAKIVQLSVVVKLVTFTTTYVGAKLIINSAVKWMYLDPGAVLGVGDPDPPATPASNRTTHEIRANPDILGGIGWGRGARVDYSPKILGGIAPSAPSSPSHLNPIFCPSFV